MIGALLTLCKEKLSQQLVNAEELSHLLSASLPPLDDQDITEVAEGFERIDRRRAEIDALAADLDAVRQLARRQRDYARAVTVASAQTVVSAETRRDDVTRRERQARADLDAVTAEAAAADEDLQATDARLTAVDVEVEARKDSDAYRSGVALADLRTRARRIYAAAGRARDAADGARRRAHTAGDERNGASGDSGGLCSSGQLPPFPDAGVRGCRSGALLRHGVSAARGRPVNGWFRRGPVRSEDD